MSEREFRLQVGSQVSQAEIVESKAVDDCLEALIEVNSLPYPVVWMPSHGPGVINPDLDLALSFFNGRKVEPNSDSPMTLLVPLQANGRCAADCTGCVFASTRVGEALVGARPGYPATPKVLAEIVSKARELALREGRLQKTDKFRVSPLMSGDPSFNGYTEDLILQIAENPDVSASRWSTIAAGTRMNPLAAFKTGARMVRDRGLSHKLRFQVSLHSTDPAMRENHVGHYRGGKFPNLIPMEEIALAFADIKEVTGDSSTLAFVVQESSVINPADIATVFSPSNTWVSLRPMIATNGEDSKPISSEKFGSLYGGLRDRGFTVVMVPVHGVEQDNLVTGQLHKGLPNARG